jgi:hypothetical protein
LERAREKGPYRHFVSTPRAGLGKRPSRASQKQGRPGDRQRDRKGWMICGCRPRDHLHPGEGHEWRMVATGTLNSTNPAWLRISMNPSTGNGGTCYGDSGGPNFLGTTDIVAATTITGDAICRSTNVTYRVDTASAREFLGQFVDLP